MKLFAVTFAVFGMLALIGGCCGAAHQFYMAGMCMLIALIFYPWKIKEK